jgi:site-specific DNA-cytosine methylase
MGWQPLAFSEIEPFPSAVLAHHWPHVPNLGDMTKWREWPEELLTQIDVLVGGTPCQAFSVAGLRNSLSDERGNLTLIYAHLLDHIDTLRAARGLPPVICLWENVPGVLSTKDNAFGCFLGALAGEESALEPSGTRWSNAGWVLGPQRAIAWRTLDAQYFGVAQRRRRVFLVASARNDFSPEAVLFEFQGVRRDSPPSREARQVAPTTPARSLGGGGLGTYWDGGEVSQTLDAVLATGQTMPEKNRFPAVLVPEVYPTLDASFNRKWGSNQWVNNGFAILDQGVPDTAHTLRAEGFDASEDGTGRGTPLVPVPMVNMQGSKGNAVAQADGPSYTLNAMHGHDVHAIAFAQNTRDEVRLQNGDGSISGALAAEPGMKQTTYVAVQPVAYRVHGEHSTAMTGNGVANVADPVEVARCLDSSGGYATNQGGNVVAFSCKDHGGDASEIAPTLRSMGNDGSHANGGGQVAVAFAIQDGALRENPTSGPQGKGYQPEHAYTLEAREAVSKQQCVATAMQVRRLTPTECERLQGFPDGHTLISWKKKPADDCPDGPRYKALGNSMAVPCMAWIGRRIQSNLPTP